MPPKNNLLDLVKFRSPLLNEQGYNMMDLMGLEDEMPEDEMLVDYDDLFNMGTPEFNARQELAGALGTRIQSTAERTPEYGFEQHMRQKPTRSVMGYYRQPSGGFDYTIDGIPMIDPVEVRP